MGSDRGTERYAFTTGNEGFRGTVYPDAISVIVSNAGVLSYCEKG